LEKVDKFLEVVLKSLTMLLILLSFVVTIRSNLPVMALAWVLVAFNCAKASCRFFCAAGSNVLLIDCTKTFTLYNTESNFFTIGSAFSPKQSNMTSNLPYDKYSPICELPGT